MRFIRGLLKVLHPSDIITKISVEFGLESILTNLGLSGVYTYGVLLLNTLAKDELLPSRVLDAISTSSVVKEAVPISKNPTALYIVKRSFGVQRALMEARAIKPSTVYHDARGMKYFWIVVDDSRKQELVNLVRKYAKEVGEHEVRVRLKVLHRLKLGYFVETPGVGPTNTGLNSLTASPGKSANLTPLEYYVLKRAYELGYFDWPRRCSLYGVAKDVGLSKTTVAEHLRRAVRKLLLEYFQY